MSSQVYELGGYGLTSILNPCIQASRNPTTSDLYSPNGNAYQISQQWLNTTTDTFFEYAGAGNWIVLGGSSADVNTINNLSPTAGNITIAGTTNKVDVSSAGSTVTLSLPNAVSGLTSVTADSFITSSATKGTTYSANTITATGSDAAINIELVPKAAGSVIQSRGLAGGDITIEATNTDNTNAASRAGFEVAVGGTSAGDPYINFLVSGAGQYTMGIDNSVSDNFVLAASGALGTSNIMSITSAGATTIAGGITSTAGNITATNGNLVLSTAGNKLSIATGANASCGSVALVAGTKTVTTTAVTASSLIFVTVGALGTVVAPQALLVSNIVAGTSFDITSADVTDTSTINWLIIN